MAIAIKTKTVKSITTTKAPLQTLKLGDWLKGPMVNALREKYGRDRDGGQRGADWLVAQGMVSVPDGHVLQAVSIRRFGGALGFVCTVPNSPKAQSMVIAGLPD